MNVSYKHISGKIKEVGFAEDAETYFVIGDVTEEQALKAIHRYERVECGLGRDEMYAYDLERKEFWTNKSDPDHPDWIWWGNKPKSGDVDTLGYGWVGSI